MHAIHHEVWIDAPVATVFKAITTREGLDAWWGRAVAAAPELGSVVEFDHGFDVPLRMRVIALARDRRVEWRCLSEIREPRNAASEWLGHRLSFDLRSAAREPALDWLAPRLGWSGDPDATTILDFRHDGWAPDSRWLAFCNLAWGATLAGLEQHCEADRSATA